MSSAHRFLAPVLVLNDGYFAPEISDHESSGIFPISELHKRGSAIIYGEPGAGKSTSLQDLCDSINLMPGRWATLLNLKDFSESDLKDEIDQITQADHGADMQRYLLIDSLDEAHVRTSRLVPFLDRESARKSLAGSRPPCF